MHAGEVISAVFSFWWKAVGDRRCSGTGARGSLHSSDAAIAGPVCLQCAAASAWFIPLYLLPFSFCLAATRPLAGLFSTWFWGIPAHGASEAIYLIIAPRVCRACLRLTAASYACDSLKGRVGWWTPACIDLLMSACSCAAIISASGLSSSLFFLPLSPT